MNSLSAFSLKVLLFLMKAVFNFFEFCVLLRFLLQWVKADFRNPFCQFLIRMTSPLLHPLRRVIPGLYGLDFAAVLLFYGLIWLEVSLPPLMISQHWSAWSLLSAFLMAIHFYLNVTFFLILFSSFMSWLPNARYHPIGILLNLLTEPYFRVIRRVIPNIGGFDFSPLIALILIQILCSAEISVFGSSSFAVYLDPNL